MGISWKLQVGSALTVTRATNLLEKFGDRVPVRENEWDNRHFWRVSNAEHPEMSENVGMVNLSHFAIYDVKGPDAEKLMEYACVAKVGGDTPSAKASIPTFSTRSVAFVPTDAGSHGS